MWIFKSGSGARTELACKISVGVRGIVLGSGGIRSTARVGNSAERRLVK
jgi:hypothetical protein